MAEKKAEFHVYNTLTKQKEVFKPIVEGKVGMYICGVTSYDFSHIGHARAYVAFDVLYRYLKHLGYEVVYVRNFTDVDDKIIRRANELNEDPVELSGRFCKEFLSDMDDLQCLLPTHQPRVTDHIDQIKDMIGQIIENGCAYAVDGDVYFSVDSFPNYGSLSGRKLVDNRAGERVAVDDRKRNPADFALWKAAKPGEPLWDSPWGPGRPGWHIECSAMSARYLTHAFDIHGGGMDLIFPHHENEIAQSCAACSESKIGYWMHNGLVTANDEKMSKSVGNVFTIREVTKLYHPLALRYFLMGTHYRSPVNYSISQIEIASEAVFYTYQTLLACEEAVSLTEENEATGKAADRINREAKDWLKKSQECKTKLHEDFEAKLADDLHTPSILNAALQEAFRSVNNSITVLKKKPHRELQISIKRSLADLQKEVENVLSVLGLLSNLSYTEVLQQLKEKALIRAELTEDGVLSSIEERVLARKNKEFGGSDIWWPALVATTVKLLLIPAYRSTDFEVHRHWLALTNSLPLSQWYSDTTSPWTLDYPPLFAYFEKFLSLFAARVDPTMTNIHDGLNYASPLAILFQRLSVIISDLVLVYAAYRLTKNWKLAKVERFMIWVLIVWSPGLFMVDHLHFQYNGFLLGLLLLSLSCLEQGSDLVGGFLFAVLICFKHLFAVAAPVYFVYLLRHYCVGGIVKGFGKLVMMGSAVLAVFAVAYGPFIYHGQIAQILHRMFPFGRGLCHAYWAPNFWVFYIMMDKLLAFVLVKLGFNIQTPKASFTGGLVGDSSPFAVLPTVTPLITFITVILAISPCLVKAWRNPQPRMVSRWISYAYTCGFMFGWHVHEKASLHFVIPLAITALKSAKDANHYFVLSIVSSYSLFPLLFEAQEYPIKVVLLLLHAVLMWFGFSSHFPDKSASVKLQDPKPEVPPFNIGWLGKFYLCGLFVVEIWGQFLHPLIFRDKFPFLPLILISVYCALGMMYSWVWQLQRIIYVP